MNLSYLIKFFIIFYFIYFTNKADGLPTFWLAALEDCWNEDPKDRPTFIEIARDLPKCIDSFARKRKESLQKNIDKIGLYSQQEKEQQY